MKNVVIEMGLILSRERIQLLERPYTSKKVKSTLFSIQGDKDPRLDGFGSQFFKDTWQITGD